MKRIAFDIAAPLVACGIFVYAGAWVGWHSRDGYTRAVLDQPYGLTPDGDYMTNLDIVVGPGKYFDVTVRYDLMLKAAEPADAETPENGE
jgi:hypothetical protein